MARRIFPVFVVTFFLLSLVPAQLKAGTVMIGGKAWFAIWNSDLGKTLGELSNASIDDYIWTQTADYSVTKLTKAENGKGVLAGPIISYQTDDKLWTLSLAFMWFSYFSQSVKSEFNLYTWPGMALIGSEKFEYELKLTRKEIDVAVARALTENIKIFGGYKRQSLDSEFKAKIQGEKFDVYKINIDINIITAGLGYSVPLSETLALGIQAGVLYIMPDLEYKDNFYDESGSIKMKDTLGFNAELTLTFLAADNIALQAGYRYQYMKFEFDDPDVDIDPIKDSFHGVTVTAVYMFPVGS